MPELPEVETVVRDLRRLGLVGRTILRCRVRAPRTIEQPAPRAFRRALAGRRVTSAARRAKYIVLGLDDGAHLLIHLRMTGRLSLARPGDARAPHEHVVLTLDDGRELRFHDPRRFGRWALVRDLGARTAALGPEPLDRRFTATAFRVRLAGCARQLKPLLLDQRFVAGIGNIYADEALFDAGLHPLRRSDTLAPQEADRLHGAIRRVLRRGVRAAGTSLGSGSTNFYSVAGRRGRNQDGLRVFRRHGQPCPRCGGALVRLVVGQRSTHICPSCQPRPGAPPQH